MSSQEHAATATNCSDGADLRGYFIDLTLRQRQRTPDRLSRTVPACQITRSSRIWENLSVTHAGESDATQSDAKPSSELPRLPRADWRVMLWMWPAVPIALVALASALLGTSAALLVAGESLGVLLFVGAIRLLGDRQWVSAGLAVIVASVIAFAGMGQLHLAKPPGSGTVARTQQTSPTSGPTDLEGQTISAGEASGADFAGANLEDANLNGLDLAGKNFDGADAAGASFEGANLNNSTFRGTDLRGACLRGATLEGADLSGADMTGADVSGVAISAKSKSTTILWPPPNNTSPTIACR
jgi:hypothetical protein